MEKILLIIVVKKHLIRVIFQNSKMIAILEKTYRNFSCYWYKLHNHIYQLIDNFTLFYDEFLNERVYEENYWQNLSNTAKVHAWSGIAFERVCLEHVPQVKAVLGISGVYTEVNSWQCKQDLEAGIFGSQIDMLIVRKDQVINLCEMKYSEADYIVNASFDRDLKRKISDLKTKTGTKYAIHPTLITTYGAANNSNAGELQANITADDLFR